MSILQFLCQCDVIGTTFLITATLVGHSTDVTFGFRALVGKLQCTVQPNWIRNSGRNRIAIIWPEPDCHPLKKWPDSTGLAGFCRIFQNRFRNRNRIENNGRIGRNRISDPVAQKTEKFGQKVEITFSF